jgi:5-methylcytosine-specific restriction endonuclease McrA
VSISKEKIFTKYVRAKAKTYYHRYKTKECWVCGNDKDLELHHVYPLAQIISDYLKEKGIKKPTNDPELREQILTDCYDKIFSEENLITLCRLHHANIHRLFGKTYSGKVADKVKTFLTKQKEKLHGRKI